MRFSRTRLSDVLHREAFALAQPEDVGTLYRPYLPYRFLPWRDAFEFLVCDKGDLHTIMRFMRHRSFEGSLKPVSSPSPIAHAKAVGCDSKIPGFLVARGPGASIVLDKACQEGFDDLGKGNA